MLSRFKFSQNLKAIILYTIIAIIFTWPLLAHITTHYPSTFPSEGGDPNMYIWFMETAANKIMQPSIHPSQMVFYPNVINFLAGYEAPIILVISTPVILLTHNPILAYNLILLLAFVLTAYFCYLLIFYLTNSFFASLIAGFSFGFSPYMVVRGVQHLDLLLLFTVPLVVLFGLKSIEQPSRKNIFWLVFSVLLTALSAWYYLVGSLVFLLILGLFKFKEVCQHKCAWIFAIIAMGILLAIVAMPIIIHKSSTLDSRADYLIDKLGANPVTFFVPHPFMQAWTWPVYKNFWSPIEASSYFGIVGVIALIVLFLPKKIQIPNRRLWISVIVIFTLLAIGAHWEILHHRVWMPFNFLRKFPPFNFIRAPNRFFVFAYLAVTIIFGYFLAQNASWFQKNRLGKLTVIGLLILFISERFVVPYPLVAISVPEYYKTLAQNPKQFAIADIPLADPGRSLYNYYQLYHHKSIVDGEYFWTAYSSQTASFIDNNKLLRNSYTAPCVQPRQLSADEKFSALKDLAEHNIQYVVVHNLLFQFDGCGSVGDFVHDFFRGQKSVYSDGEITVYPTAKF